MIIHNWNALACYTCNVGLISWLNVGPTTPLASAIGQVNYIPPEAFSRNSSLALIPWPKACLGKAQVVFKGILCLQLSATPPTALESATLRAGRSIGRRKSKNKSADISNLIDPVELLRLEQGLWSIVLMTNMHRLLSGKCTMIGYSYANALYYLWTSSRMFRCILAPTWSHLGKLALQWEQVSIGWLWFANRIHKSCFGGQWAIS